MSSIGSGIALLLFGLILLLRVITVDVPWVDDYRLGVLLTILGVISLVLTFVGAARRRYAGRIVERRYTERPL